MTLRASILLVLEGSLILFCTGIEFLGSLGQAPFLSRDDVATDDVYLQKSSASACGSAACVAGAFLQVHR